MMRYATKDAIAMRRDRSAVSRPDQAEKSSVKLPNIDEVSVYVGIVEGQDSVFSSVSALRRPEPCQTFR